jgi:hypothetical protein
VKETTNSPPIKRDGAAGTIAKKAFISPEQVLDDGEAKAGYQD